MNARAELVAYLVRAARELVGARMAFTGFHWPLLAARLARRLGGRFTQLLEPGTAGTADTSRLPTSTSDHAALQGALGWCGSTSDVLQTLVRRADLVLLDAANVDLAGRVNSTAVGALRTPTVRLPGGGGAADAAAAARTLVLLHGGADPARIQAAVEHATLCPPRGAPVRVIGRFGVLELGTVPRLSERVDGPSADAFAQRFTALGVDTGGAFALRMPVDDEARSAGEVLAEAAAAGYVAVQRALKDTER